jgi:hypothetical protein
VTRRVGARLDLNIVNLAQEAVGGKSNSAEVLAPAEITDGVRSASASPMGFCIKTAAPAGSCGRIEISCDTGTATSNTASAGA